MIEIREYKSTNYKKSYPMVEDSNSVVSSANILRRELESLHNRFDQATEPALVDSLIYEMQAVQLRYMYYLDLCKEQGIVSKEFSNIRTEGV